MRIYGHMFTARLNFKVNQKLPHYTFNLQSKSNHIFNE